MRDVNLFPPYSIERNDNNSTTIFEFFYIFDTLRTSTLLA